MSEGLDSPGSFDFSPTGDPCVDAYLSVMRENMIEHREWDRVTEYELAAFNAFAETRPDDDQFLHRTRVRTVFALIERWVDHFSRCALASASDFPELLSDSETLMLKGLRRKSKGDETAEIVADRSSLKQRVKNAYRCMALSLGHDKCLSFGGPGGQRFDAAVQVRDQITHPAVGTTWDLTKADILNVTAAWEWIGKEMADVIALGQQRIHFSDKKEEGRQ